jgi:hypothetical protein
MARTLEGENKMNKTLTTRIEKLVAAVPDSKLYEMSEMITRLIEDRNTKMIEKFEVNDEVSWEQDHVKFNGTIIRLNKSSAQVQTIDNWKYNVPAYMLKKEKVIKTK